MTPAGRPASCSSSIISRLESGVSLAGFQITVFPAAMAPRLMPSGMAAGKFQGLMTATTPSASYCVVTCSSGMGYTGLPCAHRRVSRANTSKWSTHSAISPSASLQFLPFSNVMTALNSMRRARSRSAARLKMLTRCRGSLCRHVRKVSAAAVTARSSWSGVAF